MYDIDRPKFIFVSLLEDFIRETERSLAYFFALLVFILTFLLALFGREALYTGLIGVFCLLLIKMRDFIDGFRETYFCGSNDKSTVKKEDLTSRSSFDDKTLAVMAEDFPRKFNEKETPEKQELLPYLHTCWKIIETVSIFFPDQPLQPETRQAIKKMTLKAQKYLLNYLERKYALTAEQRKYIETAFEKEETDPFLLQTQLEKIGIDEKTAQWALKITDLLKRIRNDISAQDDTFSKKSFSSAPIDSSFDPKSP